MSKIEDVSEAIADETEIAAIEEAGIIAQSQSAEDDGNPADRRLPLIARIYGIVMLIEGVVTLPIIVISCLYAIHAALSGKLAFGALNLTTILSVIHAAVLLVSTACLAIFGMLLILNKRRHIAQWTYLMIPLTLAEGLLSLSLHGLGVNLISPTVQLLVLVALHITADPSLREERRLQFALRRLDARSEYETAVSKGMAGRDLTGKGYIASMYKQYGKVISPMGCRAFLSPWYERGGMYPADDQDEPVFVGRFNIGAVSLHLPMILAKSRQENKDFYEVLDYYLNLIRNLHIRTYAYLGEMRASTNPLAYCEGGFLGGHLQLHDKIKPILKSATASFGITAFNELQELYNGKSLVEDGEFALEVLEHINDKVNEFKKEDGNLYAIYGTPAENLCGLQVKQFRAKYGIVEGVSDREYVSNSFHCHVTENITPIEKQDKEYRFWELCNGGKIQYVKYPIDYNLEAIKSLIHRAMDMGFYEGVNMSLAYCDDCGHQELEMDVCPKCGSRNLTKIDRMNGYLAYSRVHGDTRLSDAKMAEIAERKSM